ncbi:MAG: hypothetical protein U0N60_04495 [Oscillospiraceae bacterium]
MADIIHKPTKSEFKRMAAQLGYEQVVHGRWIPVENGAWAECSAFWLALGVYALYLLRKWDKNFNELYEELKWEVE